MRAHTVEWLHMALGLSKGHIDDRLSMRPDGNKWPSNMVKSDLLDQLEKEKGFLPEIAFEDRAKDAFMYRSRGIRCAQVAPGEF